MLHKHQNQGNWTKIKREGKKKREIGKTQYVEQKIKNNMSKRELENEKEKERPREGKRRAGKEEKGKQYKTKQKQERTHRRKR